jgi:hypothetical protein
MSSYSFSFLQFVSADSVVHLASSDQVVWMAFLSGTFIKTSQSGNCGSSVHSQQRALGTIC